MLRRAISSDVRLMPLKRVPTTSGCHHLIARDIHIQCVLHAPPKWWTLINPTPCPHYERVKPKDPYPVDLWKRSFYWEGWAWKKGDWKGYTLWCVMVLFGTALTPLKSVYTWIFRMRYEWTVDGWKKKGSSEGEHDH